MIYNEYAQVLEAKNPATGKLYTPDDFNVINWNDVGTAMLQDAIWANTDKLNSDAAYQDTATKFEQYAERVRQDMAGLLASCAIWRLGWATWWAASRARSATASRTSFEKLHRRARAA